MKISELLRISLVLGCLVSLGCEDPIPSPKYTIVFTENDGYIYEMDIDGSNKKRLFDMPGWSPLVSPKGGQVAAYAWFPDIQERWLVLFDLQSGEMRKVSFVKAVNETGIDTYAWSTDSRSLAFNIARSGFTSSDIHTVNTDGSNLTQLTTAGFNIDPKWSPEKSEITFLSVDQGRLSGFIVNTDGSLKRPIPYRDRGMSFRLDWSPDGSKVVVDGPFDSTSVTKAERDIFLGSRDGSLVTRITYDGQSGSPLWSPDGRRIAYLSKRDGGLNLFVMDHDGRNPKRITSHGKVVGFPFRWSPDSRYILYGYDAGVSAPSTLYVVGVDDLLDLDTKAPLRWGFSWNKR